MKIIPLITLQTTVNDQRVYIPPGEACDVSEDEADDLIERGFAVLPDGAPKPGGKKKQQQ
ncbi:hypothetical protein ACO0LF_03715 [Undibacterium sp. Di27W]|uniref:hypothetical protein n=1 Tax=Undibacterium sp. Di27W TaxID=3413036 RepID=UPI003BF3E2E9